MKNLHVWLMQIGETLPLREETRKLRTAVLADKLIKKGHKVVWWGSAFDHFAKEWIADGQSEIQTKTGLCIIPLKGIGYSRNVSLRRFLDHRIIARGFRKKAASFATPDIIVASMPSYDLAYEAVCFGRARNIPVLVDIRDPWPDIFFKHLPERFQKIAKLILCNEYRLIRGVMKGSIGIVAVSNSFLNWGLNFAERQQRKTDKVLYLGYTKKEVRSGNCPLWLKNINDKFIVSFIGTMGKYHNPEVLVDCARELYHSGFTDIIFVLAGAGDLYQMIRNKAAGLENVVLPGWLGQHDISHLLKQSSVGICPTTTHIDLFPNKAFLYLSEGLPVLSAFDGDLKDLIDQEKVGFNFRYDDSSVLLQQILKLKEDQHLREEMARNAERVFKERYEEGVIYDEYVRHIELMAETKRNIVA